MKRIAFVLCTNFLFVLALLGWNSSVNAAQPILPEIETGKVVLTWTELKTLLEEIEGLKQDITRIEEENVDSKEAQKHESPAPVDFVISQADFQGTMKEETASFTAEYVIHVLQDDWMSIPLLPENVGLESVKILFPESSAFPVSDSVPDSERRTSPQNARVARGENGYYLLVNGEGDLTVRLSFRIPIQRDTQRFTLAFTPPAAVISRVKFHIPEQGITISEMLPEGQIRRGENRITAQTVLSQRDALFRLSWQKEKESGVLRKSLARVYSLFSIDQSSIVVSSAIRFEHLPALDLVELRVPSTVEILHVTGEAIERWSTEQTGEFQTMRLTGTLERQPQTEVTVLYQLRLPELPATVTMPFLQIDGVDLLDGVMAFEASGNLEITPEDVVHGAEIAAKHLPGEQWELAENPLLYGYTFHDNTVTANLRLKKYEEIQPIVASVDIADYTTQRTADGQSVTRVLYAIRNNNRQFLMLKLPEKSEIWQAFLDGEPIKPARKESGEILIPMKKSDSGDKQFQVFWLELGYITDNREFDVTGTFADALPELDLPVQYLRWTLYLPETYEYTNLETSLKHVEAFSRTDSVIQAAQPQIAIPEEGRKFLFEKNLLIAEAPNLQGEYGRSVITNVDMVDCITHRTLEGKSMTRVQYIIRNNEQQFFTIRLPENSQIWQALLDGKSVELTRAETGQFQIPMLKSFAQGERIEPFTVEIGYITTVDKFSLKGDMLNELPTTDLPISYLRWTVYLPEDYEYSQFEGVLKQVSTFSNAVHEKYFLRPGINIPAQGKEFFFEKYLVVNETPTVRGKYRQHLGDNLYLSVQSQ